MARPQRPILLRVETSIAPVDCKLRLARDSVTLGNCREGCDLLKDGPRALVLLMTS